MFLGGNGRVTSAAKEIPIGFKAGETVLLPASLGKPVVLAESDSIWLEVRLGRTSG
jgi:hypothetical protein